MPDEIIVKIINHRINALINAIESDTSNRQKWLRYLLETLRRNSRPAPASHIPHVFRDRYARAGIDYDDLSLTAKACIRRIGNGMAYVYFTPRMYDYIKSAFEKDGPSEVTLSEKKQEDVSTYYLELPRIYIEQCYLISTLAVEPDEVTQALNAVPAQEKIKFRVSPEHLPAIKNEFWLQLKNYTILAPTEGSYPAIIVPDSGACDLLKILGTMGALPSKDEKIDLLVKMMSYAGDIKGLCSHVLDSVYFPLSPEEAPLPSSKDLTGKVVIDALTKKLETLDLEAQAIEQRPFYYLLIRRLLVSLADNTTHTGSDIITEQYQLAFSRIFHLLQAMDSLNYDDFLIGVRLCLDDIMLVMSIGTPAPAEDMFVATQRQIHSTASKFWLAFTRIFRFPRAMSSLSYDDFLTEAHLCLNDVLLIMSTGAHDPTEDTLIRAQEHIHSTLSKFVQGISYDEIPTGVSLADSGMQACHIALIHTIQMISKMRDFARVYIEPMSYFEITLPAYYFITRKHNGLTYEMDGKGGLKQHSGKLIDVWCGSFKPNVSFEKASPQYIDVSHVIKEQLKLRTETEAENTPFIVILDNTMSSFDEIHLPLLLAEYSEEIEAGNLIIIGAHSLNKFFNMGQDNTPAGLLYSFFQQEKYPSLAAMHAPLTGGFSPIGQTVHYIMAVMQHCPDLINLYQSRLRERSRLLHEQILPKILMEAPDAISIYKPRISPRSSLDTTQEESIIDLSSYWNFINICIGQDVPSLQFITIELKSLFKKHDVFNRMGFGFAETTYDVLENPHIKIFRVSIGTESLAKLEAFLSDLEKTIICINARLTRPKAPPSPPSCTISQTPKAVFFRQESKQLRRSGGAACEYYEEEGVTTHPQLTMQQGK